MFHHIYITSKLHTKLPLNHSSQLSGHCSLFILPSVSLWTKPSYSDLRSNRVKFDLIMKTVLY